MEFKSQGQRLTEKEKIEEGPPEEATEAEEIER